MSSSEIRDFIVHLRLRFQLLVAPAAFLLGVLFSGKELGWNAVIQFLNVHILYLGGATVFNSYYDKDEGPIEGVKNPPKMKAWMLYASCLLLIVGTLIAFQEGRLLALVYALSALGFSFGYSHPAIRWKSSPLLSLPVIGVFGAVSPFLMGFLANKGQALGSCGRIALIGITLMVVAMFPVAQAHQIEEDQRRGDNTFSARFGVRGVRALFSVLYPLALLLITIAIGCAHPVGGLIVAVLGVIPGVLILKLLRTVHGAYGDYDALMAVKLASGLSLNLFLLVLLVLSLVDRVFSSGM